MLLTPVEAKIRLIEIISLNMKSSPEALGRKTLFGTQNEDHYSHSLAEIYRLTHFFVAYLSDGEGIPYLLPIDSRFCNLSASLKWLEEKVIGSQP